MKLIVLCVSLFLGLIQGSSVEEDELYSHVLRRVTRSPQGSPIRLGSSFVSNQDNMLEQCDLNFHVDKKEALKTSLLEMKECLEKKTMLQVSEAEFLEHMEKCTEDTRTKFKACLNESQQFFPDFILNYDKAQISTNYELQPLMENSTISEELESCFKLINTREANKKLRKCLSTLKDINISELTSTKEDICQNMLASKKCYEENIKPCEEDYKVTIKFRNAKFKFIRICE